jgi:NAD(P)-dependent dehydrogenase (short-subunit alcohol dehydrogenase family)
MQFELTGKAALVTGSSRGIGRAVAEALAEAGASVAVHGATESDALSSARDLVNGVAVVGDLGQAEIAHVIVDRAATQLGRLDVLVNCAGIVLPAPVDDVDVETWDRTLDVNLRGAFFCAQSAARHMRPAGYGRIISISSQAAAVAIGGYLPYGVSKAGLEIMTKYLAAEWAQDGITVNAVAPAFVRTDLAAEVFKAMPDLYRDQLDRVPVRRMCEPAEVAAAVLYLASSAAGFTTGEVLHVDGGYLTQ